MTSATNSSAQPIPSDLFELDMCVLAYQVYNQSLAWPLDPFYEQWARPGASRRDNLLAFTHEIAQADSTLRGPGTTRGWPANIDLDPIMSDYRDVQPWRGCVINDGFAYRYLAAHPLVVEAIEEVAICEYDGFRDGEPTDPHFTTHAPNPRAGSTAKDRLYAFEGATGSYDRKPPAWSLMGIALERHRPDEAGYEVHIAYRGSQSGSAERAAFQAFVLEAGNPDWVTDMEFLKNVADDRIATQGEVVLGLRDAVLASIGTLAHCLSDIATRNGTPPAAVHITGHSLGAALATQFAAAVTIGNIVNTFPEHLQQWPWAEARLTTFSAPKAGNLAFANQLDAAIQSRRVWATGDPIVSVPLNDHAGVPVELTTGKSGTDNHEPVYIRAAIVAALSSEESTKHDPLIDFEPWRYFQDLGSTLFAAEADGDELDGVFPPAMVDHLTHFVEAAARVVAEPSSYRFRWNKSEAKLNGRALLLRSSFDTPATDINSLATGPTFEGVQPDSSVEGYLRRVYIVREAARNGWTVSELASNPRVAQLLGIRTDR